MLKFENTYTQLPVSFFSPVKNPNTFEPKLMAFNTELAQELGIDYQNINEWTLANYFSATQFLPGSEPIAMAYAGHQFGHFVPQLGDGRAMLLGEFVAKNGIRYDIHLKGSGKTAFSRRGDGRSALGPVMREYIVSEGMAFLKIPTTRSLAAVRTGEMVARESLAQGGVLTRIAQSHIRIGTFQFFAYKGDFENLKVLADYTIKRLYPHLLGSSQPYLGLWREVAEKQIKLIPQWMGVGFIHGVMNTDNMSLSGETIDYGPCAFMDEFVMDKVFSSIDQNGRYSYSNQPKIAIWNLARLAECLLPLMGNDESVRKTCEDELSKLHDRVMREFALTMTKKLGLKEFFTEDEDLIQSWFEFIELQQIDFTLGFIDLERILEGKSSFTGIETKSGFETFLASLRMRFEKESRSTAEAIAQMKITNPLTIPRNHLIEAAIKSSENGDDQLFFELLAAVKRPFERKEELSRMQLPPTPSERVVRTFCGT